MLDFKNITLFIADSVNCDRAMLAVDQCLKHAKFAEVVMLFDQELNSLKDYSWFMLNDLHRFIKTDFVLVIQYDGFIVNPSAWTDEFLQYDYIGAPWWFMHSNNVGNGGFSLRSKKLIETTPGLIPFHPEDAGIRENRQLLERTYGIKFAPEQLAAKFSWEENGKYTTYKNSFGFHGKTNIHKFI